MIKARTFTLTLTALAAVALAGCQSLPRFEPLQPIQFGQFGSRDTSVGMHVTKQPQAKLEVVACNATRKLMESWAPAQTVIALDHPATDRFGVLFLQSLRTSGYAVIEHSPGRAAQHSQILSLAYTLVQVDDDLYQLKLTAAKGGAVFSRMYIEYIDEATGAPVFGAAGNWTVRD